MRELFNSKFDRDFKKLKREHQTLFLDAQEQFVSEFEELLISKSFKKVSKKYRVKVLRNTAEIWEMTWSFSRPDGRATFHLQEIDGEPILVWRRIGSHDIFKQP
jgi:hypothetical protein